MTEDERSEPGSEVSVVIPTRDRPRLLGDTLESLAAQDYPTERYEVLVADDSLQDATRATVERFRRHAPFDLKYVRPSTRGINTARNHGVRAARFPTVAFVDDDVWLPPYWLTKLAAGIKRQPTAGCWAGRIDVRVEGKPPRMCSWCSASPLATSLNLGEGVAETEFAWGANMAFTRQIFDHVGPFNEELLVWGDESEWLVRLKRLGYSIAYLHDAHVFHRRLQRDLGRWTLAKGRFLRDRNNVLFHRVVGQEVQSLGQLIPRSLGHALVRGCWNGVFMAAAAAGNEWGRFQFRRVSQ